MKKLQELYPETIENVEIKGISINSKEIEKGDLFVCTMGATADRHDFIDEAISNGASAIVVSKDVGEKSVPIIKVEDTNKELPYLCQRFYDYPDQKLKMIGVTGTDGKTSTTTIIQTLIGKDLCGYIGTNGRSYGDFNGDNPNTTPDAQNMYMYLNEDHVVVERMSADSDYPDKLSFDYSKFKLPSNIDRSKAHYYIIRHYDNSHKRAYTQLDIP